MRNRATWIARNPTGGIELTKSPNGMARAPVLLAGWAADPSPGADDSGENQDHADEYDEMCRLLGQREAGDASLIHVGDEIVLDEVEQQTERHDRHPESGKTRKRRSGSDRDRERIDQSAYLLYVSIANVRYC
jgi:hypothetical protein